MSTNCLVTKLKGNVNNEQLEKFGVLTIKALGSCPITFNLNGEPNSAIPTISTSNRPTSFTLKNSVDELTFPINMNYNSYGDVQFTGNMDENQNIMLPKYSILGIRISTNFDNAGKLLIDPSFLYFCNITSLILSFLKVTNTIQLSKIRLDSAHSITLTDTDAEGDISAFLDKENLNDITLGYNLAPNNKIKGNIESLANKINLTKLKLINCSDVSGNAATMLNNMVVNGRNSGSLELNFTGSGVDYSDIPYRSSIIIFTGVTSEHPNGWYVTQP